MNNHEYYIYILTNQSKTVLYIGVTNNLSRRLKEHFEGRIPGFTQQYKCRYLIYYELFQFCIKDRSPFNCCLAHIFSGGKEATQHPLDLNRGYESSSWLLWR